MTYRLMVFLPIYPPGEGREKEGNGNTTPPWNTICTIYISYCYSFAFWPRTVSLYPF